MADTPPKNIELPETIDSQISTVLEITVDNAPPEKEDEVRGWLDKIPKKGWKNNGRVQLPLNKEGTNEKWFEISVCEAIVEGVADGMIRNHDFTFHDPYNWKYYVPMGIIPNNPKNDTSLILYQVVRSGDSLTIKNIKGDVFEYNLN